MAPDETHFNPAIVDGAVKGAWIGTITVLAVFLVAIILSGASMDLMAVAAMSALFGGSAFGAMLGASTAGARAPIPVRVRAETQKEGRP